MNKAIRIAIAAAFGVAASIPAFAQFENNGPDSPVGQGASSLSDPPPPGLDGRRSQYNNSDRRWNDGRQFRSDAGGRYHRSRAMMSDNGMVTEHSDSYGSPAGTMFYDREIHLGANPGSVGVKHGETVKFVTANGEAFTWRFDTLKTVTEFPLARIAPSDVSVGQRANVYVNGDSTNTQDG